MKYLRIFLLVCIMACMGFLAVSQEHDGVWSGQVSVALRQFYDLKQAEMINSSEINLLSNETIVFSDSTQENMYMSEHLDLMVSPEVLAKTLNLSVKAADDGKYHVSDGKKTYIFEINNDKVISDEESFGFDGCIQQNNNGIFVALASVLFWTGLSRISRRTSTGFLCLTARLVTNIPTRERANITSGVRRFTTTASPKSEVS